MSCFTKSYQDTVEEMADAKSLTTQQQEAVDEIQNNLQIIACAGSGKTEVVARRIAKILESTSAAPENIVAFTFTEKAAESMKRRIQGAISQAKDLNEMYIGTIHGFCHNLLKRYTTYFKDFRILDTVKRHLFVIRYCKKCGMSDLGMEPYPRNVNLFLSCIDKMLLDYENHEHWEQLHREVLEKYIQCVYEHQFIDFSLLIFEATRQLRENPKVQEYIKTIQYLIVDEYQDVDDLQETLIHLIADAGANICVVGDDDQTIYQFRGSNAENMITFPKRYSNVHQVKLEKNFRCTEGIVDIADCVIQNNAHRLPKKMVSARKGNGDINAIRFNSSREQYDGIAQKIQDLHRKGIAYSEIAILVRKGKHINPIANVLDDANVPYATDSSEHFFTGDYFDRFVKTLQVLADIDKKVLYDTWSDLVDDTAFNVGFKFLRSCANGSSVPLSKILRTFCKKIDFIKQDSPDPEVRKTALEGISKILDDYDEIYGDWQLSARISGILKFLGTQAAEEYKYHSFQPKDPTEDAVQLMTVHKAKGLEFDSVFLPHLENREFPITRIGGKQYWHVLGGSFEDNKAQFIGNIEDERKLFYVAVTRAKSNLYLTYELSSQPVSAFVVEAASSTHLEIDQDDLEWNSMQSRAEIDWEIVRYARQQLYDYYGTGAHFCPAMYSMLSEIKNWSPEQVLEEASRNGLI